MCEGGGGRGESEGKSSTGVYLAPRGRPDKENRFKTQVMSLSGPGPLHLRKSKGGEEKGL